MITRSLPGNVTKRLSVLLKAGLRWFPLEPDGLDVKPVELQSVFKTDIPSTVSKLPFRPEPEIMLDREHTVGRTGTGTSMLNRFMPHDDVKRLRFELGAL